jgi:hypothetical protein
LAVQPEPAHLVIAQNRMLEVTTPTSALFALDAGRVRSLFATAMVRAPQAIRPHLENAKNMSTVLKNLDYLTTSVEEI